MRTVPYPQINQKKQRKYMNIVWQTLSFNISSGVDQQEGVLAKQRYGSISYTVLFS